MYAVISTGGKQYKVVSGMLLDVERLEGEPGAQLALTEVLALRTDSDLAVGRPHVKGALVTAEIVRHLRGPKVIHFRYKRRKGHHRKVGHRQELTRLKVLEILASPPESPVAALGSNASSARREEEAY